MRTATERAINSYSVPGASTVFLSVCSLSNFLFDEVTAVAFNLNEECWGKRRAVWSRGGAGSLTDPLANESWSPLPNVGLA